MNSGEHLDPAFRSRSVVLHGERRVARAERQALLCVGVKAHALAVERCEEAELAALAALEALAVARREASSLHGALRELAACVARDLDAAPLELTADEPEPREDGRPSWSELRDTARRTKPERYAVGL